MSRAESYGVALAWLLPKITYTLCFRLRLLEKRREGKNLSTGCLNPSSHEASATARPAQYKQPLLALLPCPTPQLLTPFTPSRFYLLPPHRILHKQLPRGKQQRNDKGRQIALKPLTKTSPWLP
ncbi:hypothetical protein F4860DRAFT_368410 [Xylaria cubensis]|nr:hypothetical protein F4860DRAFT_368410 [Xylaria cubensis]